MMCLLIQMLVYGLARTLHTGVHLSHAHDHPDAAREINDPDRAYAWYGAVEPRSSVMWTFVGQAGERFRARAYVQIDQPTAAQFHPALVLATPDHELWQPLTIDDGYTPPELPHHQLHPWVPDLTHHRLVRSFHSGTRYYQGVGFDLSLPATGQYFLILLASEIGGQFMLGTGWREKSD